MCSFLRSYKDFVDKKWLNLNVLLIIDFTYIFIKIYFLSMWKPFISIGNTIKSTFCVCAMKETRDKSQHTLTIIIM